MSTANQQTLAKTGTEGRPPILKKGSYVSWVSRFLRFLDNKREEGELMQYSIDNGPLKRKWVDDLKRTPNDIYNSVDACEDAQGMWQHVKRLMQGTDLSQQERHSRLMNEFDKFSDEADESLKSVYESKDHFNKLYDYLSQCEPHVNASRVKKNARNHDPLALVPNSYANSSYSHASPSYSRSLQPYYVTHPPFVHDYKDDYQGDIQGQLGIKQLMQEMVLLKRLESEKNFLRIPRTTSTLGKANVRCYNCNGKGHYARDYPKPRVRDAKYFRVQMLLATKHEAEVNLDTEENDFMLMNAYGNDQVEDLNASMIMMARIQRTNNKSDAELTYDAEVISKKFKTIKHTSVDDQIDSDIIFDDPYVEDNSRQFEHDQDAHDQNFVGLESLIYNVQVEAKNQRIMNNELKKQNALIQRELETYKERVWDFEKKAVQFINYKSGYKKLQNQISVKDKPLKNLRKKKMRYEIRYLNPERLKKAIKAQPKMYNGKYLKCDQLNINLHDSEETLEDAEESRLKMKYKLIQLDYAKLNKLYESFVSQKEISADQTYLSPPSTSNVTLESSPQKSSIPLKEMPKETNVNAVNALKAYVDVLCVSCDKNVLIPCHDKCFEKYKLSVNAKVRRDLFTTPRTAKSKSVDTTPVVAKT
ncbi:reverse transcriptase domain-containing protein, partial [Tanacetum coccineum]